MNVQLHEELLKQYISQGGNPKIAHAVKRFSLQNYAKLKYEMKKNPPLTSPKEGTIPTVSPLSLGEGQGVRRTGFGDLISQYPVELHLTYKKRLDAWLQACSLKVSLNSLSDLPQDEPKAFEIQMQIWKCFQTIDHCQKILKHYQEHKRIMPTESKTDFSKMSELELYKYRDNLRALITRRKQTIQKLAFPTPSEGGEMSPRKLHTLNLKREQLQDKENELLECEEAILHKTKNFFILEK